MIPAQPPVFPPSVSLKSSRPAHQEPSLLNEAESVLMIQKHVRGHLGRQTFNTMRNAANSRLLRLVVGRLLNKPSVSNKDLITFRHTESGKSYNIAQFYLMNLEVNKAINGLEAIYQDEGLRRLLTDKNEDGLTIANIAVAFGKIKILSWLYSKPDLRHVLEQSTSKGLNLAHTAAVSGHVEVLEWIHSKPDLSHLLTATDTVENHWDIVIAAMEKMQKNVLDWVLTKPELVKNVLMREQEVNLHPEGKIRGRNRKKISTIIHSNYLFIAFTSGNSQLSQWFLDAMKANKILRTLWNKPINKDYSTMGFLQLAHQRTLGTTRLIIPEEIKNSVSLVLKSLQVDAENISEMLKFEDQKEKYAAKLQDLFKQLREINTSMVSEPNPEIFENFSNPNERFDQAVQGLFESIEKNSKFLSGLKFAGPQNAAALFGAVEKSIVSIGKGINDLALSKSRYDNKKFELDRLRAQSEAEDARLSQELKVEEHSYDYKALFLDLLDYIEGWTSEEADDSWPEYLINHLQSDPSLSISKDANPKAVYEQARAQLNDVSESNAYPEVLTLILKIDVVFDQYQALKLKIKQPVKVKAHQDPAVFNKIKRYTQEIETLHLQYSEQKYKGIQQALTTLLQDMQVQEERQHTLRQVKSSALTVVGEKYNQQKQLGIEIDSQLSAAHQNLKDFTVSKNIADWSPADGLTFRALLQEKHDIRLLKLKNEKIEQTLNQELIELQQGVYGAKKFAAIFGVEVSNTIRSLISRVDSIKENHVAINNDSFLTLETTATQPRATLVSAQSRAEGIQRAVSPLVDAPTNSLVAAAPLENLFDDYDHGDFESVIEQLAQNPSLINQHFGDGYTLLFTAIEDNNIALLHHLLLEQATPAQLEILDEDGNRYNAIFEAWQNQASDRFTLGHFSEAQALLMTYCKNNNLQDILLNATVDIFIETFRERISLEIALKNLSENAEMGLHYLDDLWRTSADAHDDIFHSLAYADFHQHQGLIDWFQHEIKSRSIAKSGDIIEDYNHPKEDREKTFQSIKAAIQQSHVAVDGQIKLLESSIQNNLEDIQYFRQARQSFVL